MEPRRVPGEVRWPPDPLEATWHLRKEEDSPVGAWDLWDHQTHSCAPGLPISWSFWTFRSLLSELALGASETRIPEQWVQFCPLTIPYLQERVAHLR